MKFSHWATTGCAFAVLLIVSMVGRGFATEDYVAGDLIVVFDEYVLPVIDVEEPGFPTAYQALDEVFQVYELTNAVPLFRQTSPLQNVYFLHFSAEANLDSIANEILALDHVRAVDKNYILTVDSPPNDYYFSHDANSSGELDQWPLYTMQVNRAWKITQGDPSVIIAVIDTGLDWQHPDMEGVVWINDEEDINSNGVFDNFPVASGGDIDNDDDDGNEMKDDVIGWDFSASPRDNNPAPEAGEQGHHGTLVTSFICVKTNNNYGLAGVASATRIMPLKCGIGSEIYTLDAIDAVQYAAENGARIVNMSFSTSGPPAGNMETLHLAIQEAEAAGVIFVASAGDHHSDAPRYPGSFPEVMRVAAVDSLAYKTLLTTYTTFGSSYGEDVDIAAPSSQYGDNEHGAMVCSYFTSGSNIYPGDSVPHVFRFTQIATSGAAAEVSGALALLCAAYPDSSSDFIEQELFRGAEPSPDPVYGNELGAGMVNPYRSLTQWGVVASDTTWGSESVTTTVYVSGDVMVAEGATLTIEPGTTIIIANQDNEVTGDDNGRVEINVDGELVVNGTAARPVTIGPWTQVTSEDWAGIYFSEDSEGGTFNYCTIGYANIVIDSYAPITINHSTIRGASDALISIWSSTLDINDSEVSLSNGDGILLDHSDATIDSTEIKDCFGYGLSMSGNGAINISHCNVHDNDVGVYVESNTTNGLISETRFEDNDDAGISYYYSIKPTIDECFITGNGNGIRLDHFSGPTILHCIDSASYDGDIGNNAVGIFCTDGSNPDIGYCDIHNNNTGVAALDESVPNLEWSGPNKLRTHSAYHVANLDEAVMIPAEGNYWYTNSGLIDSLCLYCPKANKILGWVDYQNALASGPNPTSLWPGRQPEERPKQLVTRLGRAHPNPFNPTIQIPFTLKTGVDVQINVYDVAGRLVKTLVHEHRERGEHVVVWDGRSDSGSTVATAVYFVRMVAGSHVESQKVVMLK